MVYATVASGKHGDPTNSWSTGTCPRRWARCAWSPAQLRGAWFTDQALLLPSSEGWLRDESNSILEQGGASWSGSPGPARLRGGAGSGRHAVPAKVWRALCALDFGVLTSYGELARTVGRPKARRPSAARWAETPLIIIIPVTA